MNAELCLTNSLAIPLKTQEARQSSLNKVCDVTTQNNEMVWESTETSWAAQVGMSRHLQFGSKLSMICR